MPTICFNVDGTGGYYAEWNKSIREGQTLYGLIHLGNINNSEREEKGWEKKMGRKYQTGRQNIKTPNSGKRTGGGGRGGGWGWVGDGHWGGHLTGWALGVILYVGKLNSNKNYFIKKRKKEIKG